MVHIAALQFFLYWKYLWLDIPVHFLGGVTVALGFAVCVYSRIRIPVQIKSLLGYMLVVFLVGISWELFEISSKISITEPDFIPDTLLDLCMDMLGGVVGYGIVKSIRNIV